MELDSLFFVGLVFTLNGIMGIVFLRVKIVCACACAVEVLVFASYFNKVKMEVVKRECLNVRSFSAI